MKLTLIFSFITIFKRIKTNFRCETDANQAFFVILLPTKTS